MNLLISRLSRTETEWNMFYKNTLDTFCQSELLKNATKSAIQSKGSLPVKPEHEKEQGRMKKDAYIEGNYRYWLLREWDARKPVAIWIMLNPSVADHEKDDPTIRKCIGFSERFGCGGLYVVNLFAYRATSPRDLLKVSDPIGPKNDEQISLILSWIKPGFLKYLIAAWGNHGSHLGRSQKIKDKWVLEHLGLTKMGQPRHPLYVPYSQQIQRWDKT